MKRLGLALMLLAAGCASSNELQWTKVSVSAKTIGALEQTGGEVTLANGDVVLLVTPRHFGDALCDRFACVRKSEIVGIRDWSYSSNDIEGPFGMIAAPLTIPVWLILWAGLSSHESRGSNSVSSAPPANLSPPPPPAPLPAPPVIPEDTLWLQTGFKYPSKNYPGKVPPSNPCAPILPKTLTTDQQALDWIYDNRLAARDWVCLSSAEQAMRKLDAPDLAERRFRMKVLVDVRHQWWNAHCSRQITRVVPSSNYTQTAFSPFALIAETLADEASYVLPDKPCPDWAPASNNPPDRATFMAAIDPFSRVNAAPWIHNRTMDDNGPENVSW